MQQITPGIEILGSDVTRINDFQFFGVSMFGSETPNVFKDTDLTKASEIVNDLGDVQVFSMPKVNITENYAQYPTIRNSAPSFDTRPIMKKKNAIILQYVLIKFALLRQYFNMNKLDLKNMLFMIGKRLGVNEMDIDKTYPTTILSIVQEFLNIFDGENITDALANIEQEYNHNDPNVKLGLIIAKRFATNAALSIE